MNITTHGIRALRTLTGMSLQDIQKAVRLADSRFHGDIPKAIGYVVISGLAVNRGTGAQMEQALAREATTWAMRNTTSPEWDAVLTLFKNPEPI